MDVILGTMTIGGQADAAEAAGMLKAFTTARRSVPSLQLDTARTHSAQRLSALSLSLSLSLSRRGLTDQDAGTS